MEFNSSLNKFGNLRSNQYRELINDEFNDARSQVIARQFTQSKQFLETYEREKVGDRLVNLEVAKTITSLNNAIIKSTNEIDNNQPNSEEGIIVAYRTAIDMLNAYINASGTKTRDTERYKQMIYSAIPALNTYYEKASQLDKIGVVDTKQLQLISDIIELLESGYSQGQNYNGKNLAANPVLHSLDAEATDLFKQLQKKYKLLIDVYNQNRQVLDAYRGNNPMLSPEDFNIWTRDVQERRKVFDQLSSYIVNGKVDYKSVAKLFNIPLLPVGGKDSKTITENRQTTLKNIIEKLRKELQSVSFLLMVANSADSPFNTFQREGSLDRRPQPDQPTIPSTGVPPLPLAPTLPPSASPAQKHTKESLKNNFLVFWEKIYRGELALTKTNDGDEVHRIQEELRMDRNEADNIGDELQHVHNVRTAELEEIKASAKRIVGYGRKCGGVNRTSRSKRHPNEKINNDALEFEKKQVKALQKKPFMEEPSLKFQNLYPKYGQRVDFQYEGNGKTKSRRSRNIILFDKI